MQLVDWFIEQEGLKLQPYKDSRGIPTIGIGTTVYPGGVKVTLKDNAITEENAIDYMNNDIQIFKDQINKVLKVELSENRYLAILDFVYNLGIGNFKVSNLLKNINSNNSVTQENFVSWNKERIKGKLVPNAGLTYRRLREWNLWQLG